MDLFCKHWTSFNRSLIGNDLVYALKTVLTILIKLFHTQKEKFNSYAGGRSIQSQTVAIVSEWHVIKKEKKDKQSNCQKWNKQMEWAPKYVGWKKDSTYKHGGCSNAVKSEQGYGDEASLMCEST